MPQQKSGNQPPQLPKQLDNEVIKSFIAQKTQEIDLEIKRVDLERLKQADNTKLAEKAMTHQAAYLQNLPSEQRKTFTRIGYVVGGIIALFLLFIGFLVYTGNKDFAGDFLKICSYLATSAISFFVGQKSSKKSKSDSTNDNSVQDADIIND